MIHLYFHSFIIYLIILKNISKFDFNYVSFSNLIKILLYFLFLYLSFDYFENIYKLNVKYVNFAI